MVIIDNNKIYKINQYGKRILCGIVFKNGDEPQYVSFRREVLRKWKSLGISGDILQHLAKNNIEKIIFNIGLKVYMSTVSEYLNSGLVLYSRIENDSTHHVRISDLYNE